MIADIPNTLTGVKVVCSAYLEEDERYVVQRTWKERLFTRPWRPFTRTRWEIRQVPARRALIMPDGTMVLHPETYRALQQLAENRPPAPPDSGGIAKKGL